ncbi:unnamed protein product [Clavelina lepadiformis]|uniref:Centrosomal protein of 128 kDa n=1 Tax=Clavelina lepadiformis TaxID=159417 RepID=A0ABP0FF12_CLALP
MSSRRHHYDSSSSESSFQNTSLANRRRLPSPPPSGILRNPARHVTIVDPGTIGRRVDRIADNLEDTTRNLRNVDSKLSDFKDLHDDSMSALTKLQEDLEGSLHRLRNTREKRSTRDARSLHESDLHTRRSASTSRISGRRSPAKDYESDITDYTAARTQHRPSSSLGLSSRRQHRNYSSSVHEKIHDLSANQARLEQDLGDEISRRLKSDRSLSESMKGDSAADRVERRLKEIERGMAVERNTAAQLASDVAKDVLHRSQSKFQEEDVVNRNRMLQLESGKRALEGELDSTRRRLEQSEGGREALMTQIAELRSMINRSDKDRANLQHKVEQYEVLQKAKLEREAENRHKLAESQKQEHERLRQENEIEQLRTALKRSAGVVQLDEARRDLEKSERQRQHLSDHIEVLTKDLEKKEQAHARILNQHQDLQHQYDESERDKDRLYNQLEDALRKLKELTRDSEKYASAFVKVEQSKNECEREREEIRNAAQDTIRQWKAKCRKQEKENERLQDTIDQLNSKNEEIVKENITGKTQANNAFQQVENLRKEMDDLIAKRANAEEKLNRRDNEIEQISEEKRMLLQQMKNSSLKSERLEGKLQEAVSKLTAANNKVSQCEAEIKGAQSMYDTSKQQTADLQREIRELKLQNSQLDARLSSAQSEHKNAVRSFEDAEKQMQAMKIEVNAVHKQLQIERETHKKELKDLHSDIHAGEVQKMDAVQRVSKKADEERSFLEGEIHRVNMEMNETKATNRESQKLLHKAKDELNIMESETNRLEAEIKTWKEKYKIVKSTYENKCTEAGSEKERLKKAEDELLWSRDRVRRLEQEIETANNALSQDVAHLEAAVGLSPEDNTLLSVLSDSFARKSSSKSDGQTWIIVLRRKLETIKKELSAKMDHRTKAIDELSRQKQQMKEMCKNIEDDRRQLMSEVTEQNKLVDSLSREKTSLLLENKEARMIVHDLEDRVANLTVEVGNESRKEREKIQQRYVKYKDTIDSLQADLEESRSRARQREALRLSSGRSPSPIKRVTISDTSPIIHGYSDVRPRSSSPKQVPEKDR